MTEQMQSDFQVLFERQQNKYVAAVEKDHRFASMKANILEDERNHKFPFCNEAFKQKLINCTHNLVHYSPSVLSYFNKEVRKKISTSNKRVISNERESN